MSEDPVVHMDTYVPKTPGLSFLLIAFADCVPNSKSNMIRENLNYPEKYK